MDKILWEQREPIAIIMDDDEPVKCPTCGSRIDLGSQVSPPFSCCCYRCQIRFTAVEQDKEDTTNG